MNEAEAEALAIQALRHLFKPEQIAAVIRRRAPIFQGARAIDLIQGGRLDEVVRAYSKALEYQA